MSQLTLRELEQELDFTPTQVQQFEPLARSKRQFDIFSILLNIVRLILGLSPRADPFTILLSILGRTLGLPNTTEPLQVLGEAVNRVISSNRM